MYQGNLAKVAFSASLASVLQSRTKAIQLRDTTPFMSATIILLAIVFVAVFTQTVSGFGMGLIMMPVVSAVFGLAEARPLVTLLGTTVQIIILFRLRHSLAIRTLGLMALLGLFGIPAGNWLAESKAISESTMLTLLAFIVITYALYALIAPTLPHLATDRWSGVAGFLSGLMTGAYNVGGPPIVIYADVRRWTPDVTRSNLQGFFLLKGIVLVFTHMLSRNFTQPVMSNYLMALPVALVGMVLGLYTYKYIDVDRFRQIVLIMLLITGLNILRSIYLTG